MPDSPARARLRRHLEAHLTSLGYSCVRAPGSVTPVPEILRVSPVRGRIAYGETVLHEDLQRPGCHERLLAFSRRRTRRRSSILFFIAVAADDEAELVALLKRLDILGTLRGGHVHLVPVAMPARGSATTKRAARS